MPAFASKKQYRMMMAILHGKAGTTARGDKGPPKSVAEKYSGKDKDLDEDKGKAHHGGKWDGDKPAGGKKKLKKADRNGVGVVVVNDRGQLLMGRHSETGEWSLPGGGIESGEAPKAAAIRELREETGLSLMGSDFSELGNHGDDSSFVAILKDTPTVSNTEELTDVGFYDLDSIDLTRMRNCCRPTLRLYLASKLGKSNRSILDLMKFEDLNKNILRTGQVATAVHEMSHADALKLVGNGAFRALHRGVQGMEDDSIREVKFGSYTLHIRKHANDVYSGNIDDGLKTIHQFVNRSLPAVTAELMSVFEWYTPEDSPDFKEDADLSDTVIGEGISKLVSNYRSYNVADIYDEMENIREEIRHGNAVDLQQIEHKIMGLFDKLEEKVKELESRETTDELRDKLISLQSKIDEMSKKPSKVEAYSSKPADPKAVLAEYYNYLSKPKVVIHPTGHITIDFGHDWTGDDKSNFLKDMKAKTISKAR